MSCENQVTSGTLPGSPQDQLPTVQRSQGWGVGTSEGEVSQQGDETWGAVSALSTQGMRQRALCDTMMGWRGQGPPRGALGLPHSQPPAVCCGPEVAQSHALWLILHKWACHSSHVAVIK